MKCIMYLLYQDQYTQHIEIHTHKQTNIQTLHTSTKETNHFY